MHFDIRSRVHCGLGILMLGTAATRDDGKIPPQVMQHCTDAKTDRLMNAFSGDMTAGLCSGHDVRKAGQTLLITANCKVGPIKVLSHSVVSGDFHSNYTVKVTSKMEGGPAFARALVAGSTTIKARWSGACRSGQRPGDIVMADGRTINIRELRKMLGGGRAPGPAAK
jgi:hypothetical protein